MFNSKQVRYKTILRHLLFWLAYFVYEAVSEGWADEDTLKFALEPQFLTAIPVAVLLTYLNLYLLMPRFYYKQKYARYAMAFFALILFGALLNRFLNYAIWIPWDNIHDPSIYANERKDFWITVRIMRNMIKALPVVIVTMLISLMRNDIKKQKNLREMEKEKFSAEMGLLKAQVNPHFFFNTLNSLYSLILNGSNQAAKVVLRLADLMHYMLHEASSEKVPVSSEIKYLENFIGIEQMRFAERLEVSFQYSGDIHDKMIAPLLLLPFVENAFKHSLTESNGWITINLKVTGAWLYLHVENSYNPAPVPLKSGLGLKNVKRRLELTYPGRHQLSLNKNSETFEANLKIEL